MILDASTLEVLFVAHIVEALVAVIVIVAGAGAGAGAEGESPFAKVSARVFTFHPIEVTLNLTYSTASLQGPNTCVGLYLYQGLSHLIPIQCRLPAPIRGMA